MIRAERFIVLPNSEFLLYWQQFMTWLYFYILVAIPLKVGYQLVLYNLPIYFSVIVILVLNTVFKLFTAVEVDGRVIQSRLVILKHWLRCQLVQDSVALFAFAFFEERSPWQILKLLFLVKCFEIGRFRDTMDDFFHFNIKHIYIYRIMKMAMTTLLLIHYAACLLMYLDRSWAGDAADESRNWISYFGLEQNAPSMRYFIALTLCIKIYCFQGYSDDIGWSVGQRMLLTGYQMAGVFYVVYTLSSILYIYIIKTHENNQKL